jgi:hypothetical protein
MEQIEASRRGEREKTTTNAPALAIGGKFSRYRQESEKTSKKADVKEDQVIEQLKAAWKRYRHVRTNTRPAMSYRPLYNFPNILMNTDDNYRNALRTLEGIAYSASDVERFAIAIAEFQDEKEFHLKAGIFLSALINSCEDEDFTIQTAHLSNPPKFLGMKNKKNITVEGSVGDLLGYQNRGTITVEGDAGVQTGREMEDGRIIIKGNVGCATGFMMVGGLLRIHGDCDDILSIKGGEIHLFGDYHGIHYFGINNEIGEKSTGRIYLKGRLIAGR